MIIEEERKLWELAKTKYGRYWLREKDAIVGRIMRFQLGLKIEDIKKIAKEFIQDPGQLSRYIDQWEEAENMYKRMQNAGKEITIGQLHDELKKKFIRERRRSA